MTDKVTRRHLVIPTLLAATIGCAEPPLDQRIVNDAVAALGGRDRLLAARTIALEDGSGQQFNLGQDMRPGANGQTFAVSALSRRIDVTAGRARTEMTRTPNFQYFQGQAPQRQIQGIDGSVGYNVSANDTATRIAEAAAKDRRADFYHHPVILARAAIADGARLANAAENSTERRIDVTTADGFTVTLVTDPSGLPTRTESSSAHPNLGDVRLATLFADYQTVSGLKLPASITTKVDDFVTGELRYGAQSVDSTIDIAAPSAVTAAAAIAGPPPPTVVVQDIAPGIWLLAGQSHHSVLVELSRSSYADRRAAERGPDAGGHRQGARAASGQAADARS